MQFPIKSPQRIEYADFRPDIKTPLTKYGLPNKVKFCETCVISNQRPNSSVEYGHTEDSTKVAIHFDEHGVCDACRFAEKKSQNIDWDERRYELEQICDRYRSRNGSYDCVVPGSGGKDSFFASHILKYEFNMNPLTVTWAPHLYTDWGRQNFYSWLGAGFDNYLMTPNPLVHRLLTRLSTELLFHPFQPFMIGQKSLAPKMAIAFNIPLVFFGENEAEYGNPIADADFARRDTKFYSAEHTDQIHLGGVAVKDLISSFGLREADLETYMPADLTRLEAVGVDVHYLGYYLKWHPQSAYYHAVEHGNFIASPERTPGTYSKYNSIDDKIDDLHYFTTGIKFGIGRASYDAAQEIRSGDIDREEGVALVTRFDHEFPERFFDELADYLSIKETELPIAARNFEHPVMTRDYFDRLTDKFRSPHIWQFDGGSWSLRNNLKVR